MISIWEDLVKKGIAEKFLEGKYDRYKVKDDFSIIENSFSK
jgi:hypothetical protein